jgi:hypothetical protein
MDAIVQALSKAVRVGVMSERLDTVPNNQVK